MCSSAVHAAGAPRLLQPCLKRNPSRRQQGSLISPFSVSPSGGKPGRAGSPTPRHAARQPKPLSRFVRRLPPQEGCAPLCIPAAKLSIPPEFLRDWRLLQNNSCRNTHCQVKNDLVLGASRWPVFTRPSLAAFHLTAEALRERPEADRLVAMHCQSKCCPRTAAL